MDVGQRRQPEAGARGVELAAAELQAAGDGALGTTPQRAPQPGAGEAGAERVDRKVRFAVWIHVGDERGERQLLELGGERGGEREDVGDDGVRLELAQQRLGIARGVHDRLVEIERLGP